MYKKINNTQNSIQETKQETTQNGIQKPVQNNRNIAIFHAQHKAQFNIDSTRNASLNEMKDASHQNFINNTNNMREQYQKQHLEKANNIQINLEYRG